MCIFLVGHNYIGIHIENTAEIGLEIEPIPRGAGRKAMRLLGFQQRVSLRILIFAAIADGIGQ